MSLNNPFRHYNDSVLCPDAPFPSVDAERPLQLLASCPVYKETPLHHRQIEPIKGEFFIKDERGRMGLGSFKALGAAYVIAHLAQQQSLANTTFITASAGNHGLSVAAVFQQTFQEQCETDRQRIWRQKFSRLRQQIIHDFLHSQL